MSELLLLGQSTPIVNNVYVPPTGWIEAAAPWVAAAVSVLSVAVAHWMTKDREDKARKHAYLERLQDVYAEFAKAGHVFLNNTEYVWSRAVTQTDEQFRNQLAEIGNERAFQALLEEMGTEHDLAMRKIEVNAAFRAARSRMLLLLCLEPDLSVDARDFSARLGTVRPERELAMPAHISAEMHISVTISSLRSELNAWIEQQGLALAKRSRQIDSDHDT